MKHKIKVILKFIRNSPVHLLHSTTSQITVVDTATHYNFQYHIFSQHNRIENGRCSGEHLLCLFHELFVANNEVYRMKSRQFLRKHRQKPFVFRRPCDRNFFTLSYF